MIRARTINAQADAGMDGFAWSRRCLDFFCLKVNRLPDFIESALLQAAIARDMRGDLQFLAVGIGLDIGFQASRCHMLLNMQGSREKDRSQSERPAQAGTSSREKRCGCHKRGCGHNPPQGGPPQVDSGDHA
jgi:hypothetical protein